MEQETVMRWDEETDTVSVWSASPKTWRKAAKLGWVPQREGMTGGAVSSRSFTVPKAEFRWGMKSKRAGRPGFGARRG